MRNKRTIVYLLLVPLMMLAILSVIIDLNREEELPVSVLVGSGDSAQLIHGWKNENAEYYLFLPGYARLDEVHIRLNTQNSVCLDGKSLVDGMNCGNLEVNVPYSLSYTVWGVQKEISITLMRSENIPALYITTASGNMEFIHGGKGNEETGSMALYATQGDLAHTASLAAIKGRGNYTWEYYDKKSYSLTLNEPTDLLGMGQAERWVLLSNASDPSCIRNKVVYDFAAEMGLQYSPETRWVDLYLNGSYAGLYLLCERNEVHPQRVDLAQQESFLVSMELEGRLKEQGYPYIVTDQKQALRIHYPAEHTLESRSALLQLWQSTENAILAEDGIDPVTGKDWTQLIDSESWVRKYLIEEVFGNYDAGAVSQFFYCDGADAEKRIYAGPIWDYDNSMGSEIAWQLQNPHSFLADRLEMTPGHNIPWMYSLYRKMPFRMRLEEMYKTEWLPRLKELVDVGFYELAREVESAAEMNAVRWSMEGGVMEQAQKLSEYMQERLNFLNSLWLEDAVYYRVRLDRGNQKNYAHFAVEPNGFLSEVPQFPDSSDLRFLGWYYEGTDELFDTTKPITQDTNLCVKWEDRELKRIKQIGKLVPLGGLGLLGVVILVVDIQRMKRQVTKRARSKREKISS